MKKEQLIRICLAMLLASATLMLSSCKKEPKDKAPEEALVGTRWQTSVDVPSHLDIPSDGVNQVTAEIAFTSKTEGFLTASTMGITQTLEMIYNYDATNKGYRLKIKAIPEAPYIGAKVDWSAGTLTLYESDEEPGYTKPMLIFRRVK